MTSIARFVALDVHKHSVMVAAIDAAQQIVLAPRKISLERFAEWALGHLTRTDQVVLEATTNAWTLYDQLAPLVQEVQIAHPLLVKLISSARVKTDTRDTLHLARLLAAGLIPQVSRPTASRPRAACLGGTPCPSGAPAHPGLQSSPQRAACPPDRTAGWSSRQS